MNAVAYSGIFLIGVFLSSVSQVLLKKAAMKKYSLWLHAYLNPMVIFAYAIFLATTVFHVLGYKGISLSFGTVLEMSGYIFVTAFGAIFFHESVTLRKVAGLLLIAAGVMVCYLWG